MPLDGVAKISVSRKTTATRSTSFRPNECGNMSGFTDAAGPFVGLATIQSCDQGVSCRLGVGARTERTARMTAAQRTGAPMMDEYTRQLCAEFETLRQATEKVQDDEALSKNLAARLAEIVERLKLVGIDPDTLQPPER